MNVEFIQAGIGPFLDLRHFARHRSAQLKAQAHASAEATETETEIQGTDTGDRDTGDQKTKMTASLAKAKDQGDFVEEA